MSGALERHKNTDTFRGLICSPDLSFVCGEVEYHDNKRDVICNPIVLVEVLSPSTEQYDRGKKWLRYQTIPSLKHYLLIAQDEPRVEHYFRQPDNKWLLETRYGLDSEVEITSINCTLRLRDLYEDIELPNTLVSEEKAS